MQQDVRFTISPTADDRVVLTVHWQTACGNLDEAHALVKRFKAALDPSTPFCHECRAQQIIDRLNRLFEGWGWENIMEEFGGCIPTTLEAVDEVEHLLEG